MKWLFNSYLFNSYGMLWLYVSLLEGTENQIAPVTSQVTLAYAREQLSAREVSQAQAHFCGVYGPHDPSCFGGTPT